MAGETVWGLTRSLGCSAGRPDGLVTGTCGTRSWRRTTAGRHLRDCRRPVRLTVPFAAWAWHLYEYRGLFLRAGYEVTNFFGLFERQYYVDDFAEGKTLNRSSNLALDGFFVQFGLAF